jgi:hypothetical protein
MDCNPQCLRCVALRAQVVALEREILVRKAALARERAAFDEIYGLPPKNGSLMETPPI